MVLFIRYDQGAEKDVGGRELRTPWEGRSRICSTRSGWEYWVRYDVANGFCFECVRCIFCYEGISRAVKERYTCTVH